MGFKHKNLHQSLEMKSRKTSEDALEQKELNWPRRQKLGGKQFLAVIEACVAIYSDLLKALTTPCFYDKGTLNFASAVPHYVQKGKKSFTWIFLLYSQRGCLAGVREWRRKTAEHTAEVLRTRPSIGAKHIREMKGAWNTRKTSKQSSNDSYSEGVFFFRVCVCVCVWRGVGVGGDCVCFLIIRLCKPPNHKGQCVSYRSCLLRSVCRSPFHVHRSGYSRTKRYGQQVYRYVAPSFWNALSWSIIKLGWVSL